MAHIAKYQSGAIGHMCALYENEAMQANGYNLGPKRLISQVQFISERISALALKRHVRKDAVSLCDCIVTLPRSFDDNREWLYSPAAKKILKRSWHIEAEPSAKPLRHKGTDLIRLETPLPAITVYAVKGAPTGETSWDNIDLTLREISEATVEKQEEALRKKRSLSSRCPSYKNGAPAGRQIKQTKDTGFETPTKPHGILGRLKGLFDKFRK